MISKKFIGVVMFAALSFSMAFLGGNSLYAKEAHKDLEKGLAPKHKTEEQFVCPSCKEVRVSPEKGRTLAATTMACPDCKNEISELAVHHCDVCGEDVLACVLCKVAAAELKATTVEAKCPKCGEVRASPIKGRTLAKWEMKCPDCKKKTKEWLIGHCEECDVDFLICPICQKHHTKT